MHSSALCSALHARDIMDTERVIVHCDCDAFYAQCEEVRDPGLRSRPLGITQKYLIVTSNYPARQQGVAKLMSIKEAQQKCPNLVLISGEDLTPYRKASKLVLAVLQRFGTAERLGMDEVVVDVTDEVDKRISQGTATSGWSGHVHKSSVGVVQENRHRVMDLRANTAVPTALDDARLLAAEARTWRTRLMVGSQIAAEARAALKAEVGFRSSAGIACNRMLAKLCSGLHKPDDQTILLPTEAANFVGPLPLRAIPGVGFKLGAELKELGLETVEELRAWSEASLIAKFGARIGAFLHQACRGLDPTPVKVKQPPKAVTVEDSFKSCTSIEAVRHVLQILAPDLLVRVQEEYQDEGRIPKTLTLKWRHKQDGWSRSSASCPLPAAVQVKMAPDEKQATALVDAAMALFRRSNSGPFVLTLLNLGATNFTAAGPGNAMPAAFTRLLGSSKPASQPPSITSSQAGVGRRTASQLTQARRDYGGNPSGAPISKMQERFMREQAGAPTRSSAEGAGQESQAFAQQPQRSVLSHRLPAPYQHASSDAAHPIRLCGDERRLRPEGDTGERLGGPECRADAPLVQGGVGACNAREEALRGAAEARSPAKAAPGGTPEKQDRPKKWDATAAEIRRLQHALDHTTAVDAASALDPDLRLAIRLQQQELHLDVERSKKHALGSSQKRSLVGPLDNFFTRHKKSRER